MSDNRKHSRIKLKSQCSLIINEGNTEVASLDDLSFGGALVEINSDIGLHVGDVCQLELSLKTAEQPIKRASKIVRLTANKVGVKFIS